MNSSPKIFVFKMRSLIYTLLLLFFTILLIVCLTLMFFPRAKKEGQVLPDNTKSTENPSAVSAASYIPGVYTSSVSLGDSAADIEVTLDATRIRSIRLVNLSEATTAAFPLVSPAFEHIASQVINQQSTDGITSPAENRYTSQLLLSVISDILTRAAA